MWGTCKGDGVGWQTYPNIWTSMHLKEILILPAFKPLFVDWSDMLWLGGCCAFSI